MVNLPLPRWGEEGLTDRGFKALKQMTKMNYLHLDRPEEALKTYRELLGYTKVSRVKSEVV